MYMTGLVNAVNLPLGLLLIFALDLGVAGAGLATLLATMAGTAFMVWYGRRRLPADLGLLRRASLAGWRAPLRPLLPIAWPESTLLLLGMANEAILVAFVARLGGRAMIGESDTPPCTWGVKLALECTVSYHFQRSWSPG